mgnify:CR=1 FL=1
MNRIAQLDPATATGKTKQLLDGVQAKLGIVPNLFRVFGNSTAALEGYLNFSGALAGGVLDAKVRGGKNGAPSGSAIVAFALPAR